MGVMRPRGSSSCSWLVVVSPTFSCMRTGNKATMRKLLRPWAFFPERHRPRVLAPTPATSKQDDYLSTLSLSPSVKGEDGTRWFQYLSVLVFFPVMILCVFVGETRALILLTEILSLSVTAFRMPRITHGSKRPLQAQGATGPVPYK